MTRQPEPKSVMEIALERLRETPAPPPPPSREQIRTDHERREAALAEGGFSGIHQAGDLFGHEFTICTRCGSLVSLEARQEEGDEKPLAWAISRHINWHEGR